MTRSGFTPAVLRAGASPREQGLGQQGLSTLAQRRLRGHLTATPVPTGRGRAGDSRARHSHVWEGNKAQQAREGFRLGAETSPREDRQAGGRQRDRLPGELGQPPCFVGFKICLGKALGNLVRSHSWPCSEHGCPRDLLRSLPT